MSDFFERPFSYQNTKVDSSISGGDINQATLIEHESSLYFVKYNTYDNGLEMFRSEFQSLNIFREHNIATVTPHSYGNDNGKNFLILTYERVSDKVRPQQALSLLMKLHKVQSPLYGNKDLSFLGNYSFEPSQYDNWEEYFILERLKPMIEACISKGLLGHNYRLYDEYIKKLSQKTPFYPPSLLHGDLWSGNILETEEQVLFIDPAILYGHPDLDLAMLSLFGGYYREMITHYLNEMNYEKNEFANRMKMYQSYYLLFHLWKFGRSYQSQTQESLDTILR